MWHALALFLLVANGEDLRVDYVRESLTGTYIHYQQYINGIPVVGGERIERDGEIVVDRLARTPLTRPSTLVWVPALGPAQAGRRAGLHTRDLIYVNIDGEARLTTRVIVEEAPLRPFANYYDAVTGALLRSDPLFWTAKGRVFDPNPVTKLNAVTFQDQDDGASAIPEAAYSLVDLPDAPTSGPLIGPNVKITDLEQPHTTPADALQPLTFDRNQTQFEEVNAYYHIDRTQRYMQSLGYVGSRRIVDYALPVDPHAASGTDNSYFIASLSSGLGALYFGDGGTDDAEDSDIVMHEFGHAIQEWIAPGAFGGPSSGQPRALAEGFADYWAFSSKYAQSLASGRDPFCIGDWDARCSNDTSSQMCGYPTGADCLRRVDGTKTMENFVGSDNFGNEHRNGEIWSSALREILVRMTTRYGVEQGRRMTDTMVLEGTFGAPSTPTFALMAHKLMDADSALNGGQNRSLICQAMTARGIITPAECIQLPRGEVTWFQSGDHGISGSTITSTLTINDSRVIDRLTVNVSTENPAQVVLIGPDGQRASVTDPTALDTFRGRPAAGTWTLAVSGERATLLSWALVIQFAGDQRAAVRPAKVGRTKNIAAVAHTPGAFGTNFVSDVRIFNRAASAAQVMAIFTPSGADGRNNFAAVKMVIAPSQIMALDDVLQTMMQTTGIGQLELSGDVDQIIVTSRTYTRGARGTYGQLIPGADSQEGIGSGDAALSISQIENTAGFRSNIGFAEVAGESGEVRVRYYNASGDVAADAAYAIAPFGHVQTRVSASGEALRAEVTVSGAARVLAYASVVDNHSGDAVFIPAARIRRGFFPAIHAAGAFGTLWRTDVWLSNTGTAQESVDLSGRSIVLPPRGAVVLRDVLPLEGRAVLQALPSPVVLVSSRTYTDSSEGTFGQFIPPSLNALRRLDPPATIVGIENSAVFRTNIGLMNTSADPATVRLIAYDGAGREVGRSDLPVEGFVQTALPWTVVAGRVTAQVIDGSGTVIPYASVIDNVSGDPIYIEPRY